MPALSILNEVSASVAPVRGWDIGNKQGALACGRFNLFRGVPGAVRAAAPAADRRWPDPSRGRRAARCAAVVGQQG